MTNNYKSLIKFNLIIIYINFLDLLMFQIARKAKSVVGI